ncbi:GAD-like domain-containing protein [Herbaspirillum sp.]|uniref:GAD-like domain-containing protein n=2 Tax=unclassified Herbaspirillum TaxID=2624150 RepID=UPI000C0A0565|nr:GAD-like domain-containing protein [Herbaspirillum sp.]MAF03907.1 GAD-like domain protein [Herbaspirillum sp.]MBO16242.1 GAD-like domain protein [Herbaspirillum sp.]|tara:strand:+ start:1583 stop:2248 length:666 start_codon:yes stop_codon:yes gene_type:complete
MRDEDFEYFISNFGEATKSSPVPSEILEKWRDKLPDQLLKYWEQEGWCEYANGLFCTVDPDDYEDIVDEWLADTGLDEIDAFHVIARSAFGTLYVSGEKTGRSVTIVCARNMISALKNKLIIKNMEDQDSSIRSFFVSSDFARFDMEDENGQPLFERARSKLGPLEPHEIYGFEPAIVLGGKIRLENLVKVKTNVHLTILRQFAEPELPFAGIDIEKLLDS